MNAIRGRLLPDEIEPILVILALALGFAGAWAFAQQFPPSYRPATFIVSVLPHVFVSYVVMHTITGRRWSVEE